MRVFNVQKTHININVVGTELRGVGVCQTQYTREEGREEVIMSGYKLNPIWAGGRGSEREVFYLVQLQMETSI